MISYSIIQKSQLEGALRLDPEFYCHSSQIDDQFVLGKDAVEFIQYGTSKELNEEKRGFPVLRLNEFDGFFIEAPSKYCNKISEDIFDSLKLKAGDVLICRTNGNPKLVGKSAIVLEDVDIAFASYLFRVRPKKEIISPESLTVFLNSKVGRNQIERFLMPSIQSNFSPTQFRAIKIPLLPKGVQEKINYLVRNSYKLKNDSDRFYSEAESLLLEELGLKDFENEESLFNIVNLSEVKKANRMDADYFQSEYELLISKIKNYKNGYSAIGKEFNQIRNNFRKEKEKLYNYMEISDVDVSTSTVVYREIKSEELPANAKIKFGDRQLITSKVRPNRGATAILENHNGFIGSGAFVCLTEKGQVNLETLQVYLKLKIIRDLLLRYNAGTSYPVINDEDILNLNIPLIKMDAQEKIADLLVKSHEARKKAKELLEEAKNKVEELIESK